MASMVTATRNVVVRNGQGVIEDLKSYPEGAHLRIVVVDDGEEMDAQELQKLDDALNRSVEDEKAGRVMSAQDAIAKLRASR